MIILNLIINYKYSECQSHDMYNATVTPSRCTLNGECSVGESFMHCMYNHIPVEKFCGVGLTLFKI